MAKSQGFGLLEVMLALFVLAIAGFCVMKIEIRGWEAAKLAREQTLAISQCRNLAARLGHKLTTDTVSTVVASWNQQNSVLLNHSVSRVEQDGTCYRIRIEWESRKTRQYVETVVRV